ncbi:magnesium transporter NIPA-domain-containing protein [Absidia repens]|uniref:Magnesium transporter NIPA-domain-containing protein n=1 Tax=Absidia repens TaxID=90262 RepID=A0A1X2II05_9FUNG|nr:magnesium transporter NIPA-domain-containing protein [Absidia repens]
MDADQEERDLAFKTFIGVVVSVCGNALISVALNVQKLAHNKLQEQQMANYFANMDEPPRWISTSSHNTYTGNAFYPDDGYSSPRTSEDFSATSPEEEDLEHQRFIMAMAQEQRDGDSEYLRSKLWWLGITLMILGEVGNFVAYGFAPASTIAPLGTTTLVANVIMAPLMLKEVFRKRDFVGIILAVAGAAIVVLSSNEQETALSPDLIMEALMQTRSIIYFIVTGAAIVTLTAISPWYGAESILVDLGLVAIYGGYTVLCTKSVASLLSLTLLNMFAYPISYFLILALVVTAILQIKYLNKALQRFDSTAVIPTQFVLFTVSAIIGSAAIYHDFDGMSLEQLSRFMSGCTVEFVGVYLITSKRNKRLGSLALQPDKDELPGVVNESTAILTTPRSSLDDIPEEEGSELQPTPPYHHQQQQGIELGRPFGSGRLNAITQQQQQHHHSHHLHHQYPTSHASHGLQQLQHQNNEYQAITQDKQRRRSSFIRGLSLASQLVDRTNDESESASTLIQLPTPSTSTSSISSTKNYNDNIRSSTSSSSHRKSDSKLNNILFGLSHMAHDVLSSGVNGTTNQPAATAAQQTHADEETTIENGSPRTTPSSSASPSSLGNSNGLTDSQEQSQQEEQQRDSVNLLEMDH